MVGTFKKESRKILILSLRLEIIKPSPSPKPSGPQRKLIIPVAKVISHKG